MRKPVIVLSIVEVSCRMFVVRRDDGVELVRSRL